jgi:hypothetical protein
MIELMVQGYEVFVELLDIASIAILNVSYVWWLDVVHFVGRYMYSGLGKV